MSEEQEIQTGETAQNPEPKKTIYNYFTWWKNPTDRFSFLLVLVTFLLFIATAGLYYATRDLVQNAEKTAEQQLRAYVGLKRDNIIIRTTCPDCNLAVPMPDGVLERNNLQVLIKNFGQTPAYQPYMCPAFLEKPVGGSVLKAEADKVFQECTARAPKIYISTIWPGEERNFRIDMAERNVATMRRVRDRSADAFLIGKIEYSDIFDKPHESYICYQYLYIDGTHNFSACATGASKDK